MSITLKTGASAVSVTGGSNEVFSLLSTQGSVAKFVSAAPSGDYRLVKTLTVKSDAPTPNSGAPNGMSQARTKASLVIPKILANGKITTATVRMEVGFDVEVPEADRTSHIFELASSMTDATVLAALVSQVRPA